MKIIGKWKEIEEEESEDREGEVTDSGDDDDDDDGFVCPPIYFDPLVWRRETVEFEVWGHDSNEDTESEETETETQVAEGKTTTMENDVENATETRIYEGGEFGYIEDSVLEEINQDLNTPMHRHIYKFPPIDHNEMDRMQCRLMNRIKELAEERTMEMYRSLLDVPEKAKALPADLKEKAEFIMAKKQEDPSFQISSYDPDMMEFTFDPWPWFLPYNHLHVIRDKENGKRAVAGGFFNAYARKQHGHDEERDEQFFQLHERLEDYMKTKFPEEDLWKLEVRRRMRKEMFNHVKEEGFAGHRLRPIDMLNCAETVILAAEKKELVEEYRRSKNNLWELLHEKELNYSHPEVKAEFLKLKSMRRGFFSPMELQDQNYSWRSVFDESDKEKWMEHTDAEHELIERQIKQGYGMAEHFKLKKKVAIEIGVWKASFEEIYNKYCGDHDN